jgi:transposase
MRGPTLKRKSRGPYGAAKINTEVREAIAKLGVSLLSLGVSRATFDRALVDAGFNVSKSTLNEHMRRVRQGESVFAKEEKRGRLPLLTDEQVASVVGMVLWKNSHGIKVSREVVQTWIRDFLGIEMSISNIGRLLGVWGFVYKSAGHANKEIVLPDEELVTIAFDFLKHIKTDGLIDPAFYNLDFTYSKHRNDDTRSYSPKSKKGKKLAGRHTPYTNCFVTCYKSDGSIVRPMMFTSNPAFKNGAGNHWAVKKARVHFRAACVRYGINWNSVFYMPGLKGKFVKESHDIIEIYLRMTPLEKIPIFTDNGTVFHKGGASVIESAGYKHVLLPAPVHQHLSVNDNNAHGYAKRLWRARVKDHSDDVISSLVLLQELGSIPHEKVVHWFNRNYVLYVNNMEVAQVAAVITGPNYLFRKWHNVCLHKYTARFMTPQERSKYITWSELDGKYWVL